MYAELPCNIKLALHFMNKKYSGLQLAPQGKQNKPGTSKPKEVSDKKKKIVNARLTRETASAIMQASSKNLRKPSCQSKLTYKHSA